MSRFARHIYCIPFFIFFFVQVKAQREVDSLRVLIADSEGIARIDLRNVLASRLVTIDPLEAQRVIDQTLNDSKEIGYSSGMINAWLVGATLFSLNRNHAKVDELIDQVFDLAQETNYSQGLINAYLIKGNEANRKDEFDTAVEVYLKGLELAREIGDRKNEASFLINIGRIKEILNQLDEAGRFLLEAVDILEEEGDVLKQALANINLGVLEYKKQNLGLSIEYNQKALVLSEEIGDKAHIALSLQNLGFAHGVLREYKKAHELYDRSLAIRYQIDDQYGIGKTLLNKAKIFDAQGRTGDRQKMALEAQQIADKIETRLLAREVYAFLYQTHKRDKKPGQALVYHERLAEIKDSLALEANQKRIDQLTARYEFDQLINENRLQRTEAEVRNLQIEQRNALILGLSILFVLLVVIYMVQRKRMHHKLMLSEKDQQLSLKEKELVNLELENRKNQLVSYAQQLQLKDTVLEETRAKLTDLKNGRALDSVQIGEFLDLLNESLSQKDWPKFKLYFEAAHPGFFEKLNERSPEVTLNDQRLAAMIKISLTNKEMGNVFNISPDSVVRAKHRLKSKLDFDTPQLMENFIAKL